MYQRHLFCLITLVLLVNTVFGDQLHDYNNWDINIPDNCTSVFSDLLLSGAPNGSEITGVTLYCEIEHPRHSDLTVWLTTYYNGGWHDHMLVNQGGVTGSGTLAISQFNLTDWNGVSPNQIGDETWYLSARDCVTGQTGYIHFFELWIEYDTNTPPATPTNPSPANWGQNVAISTDLDWSCSDADGNTIYYTVFLERNDSSPDTEVKHDEPGSNAPLPDLVYNSIYYWQVKADDHLGGISWSPVWNFHTESEPVVAAQITNTAFSTDDVIAGNGTVNLEVSLRNTGNVNGTFWIGVSSIRDGGSTWYNWSPSRISITLSPNQTGARTLSWSPSSETTPGSYGTYIKIYLDETGEDYTDDGWYPGSFSVSLPPFSVDGRIAYHCDSDNSSLHPPINNYDHDGEILLYNPSSGLPPESVTADLPIKNAMNPNFAPDGGAITFMALPQNSALEWSNMHIFTLNLAEGSLFDLGVGQDPKFSPDGNKIIFKRNGNIWEKDPWDVSSESEIQLYSNTKELSGPGYCPTIGDGRIVFWSTYNVGSDKIGDIVMRYPNGTISSIVTGDAQHYCYYPIWQTSSSILFTISSGSDDIYLANLNAGTYQSLSFNTQGEEADPFPIGDLIGFSGIRTGSSHNNYNLFISEGATSYAQELTDVSTDLGQLGGTFTPTLHSRSLTIVTPTNGQILETADPCLIQIRSSIDESIWAGANISLHVSGSSAFQYSGFNDNGIDGDVLANDGIYSKFVIFPQNIGPYQIQANANTIDNGNPITVISPQISVEISSTAISNDSPSSVPLKHRLFTNRPNPVNPTTTLRYDLPEPGFVHLTIYNQLGQPVRTLVNREESAGYKSIVWDARDNTGKQVSTGIYFYKLEVNGFSQTRKMVFLK